jgi:hypothetical protein
MMRSTTRLVLTLTAVTLAGCTFSGVPITNLTPQSVDERLVGTWRAIVSEDDLNPDLLTLSKLDGRLLLESISEDAADHIRPEIAEVITANFDGMLYASIIPREATSDRPQWALLRYEHDSPARIQVYIASLDLLDDAVNRKLIAGRKHSDRHLDMFELEVTEADLRAFVISHGAGVFSLKGPVLERTAE